MLRPVRLPVRNLPRQRFAVALGAREFRLTVWRQPNDRGWYLSAESGGAAIVTGRRIVVGSALLPTGYGGNLWCVHTPNADAGEPGAAPWGATHDLVWI